MRPSFSILSAVALTTFCFFFSPQSVFAATYYIDATGGNDLNTGTSTAQAWQTIAKVNSSSFLPGDNILFKRGEAWDETLTVPSSGALGNPITFGAYGSGANPNLRRTIDGSTSVCIYIFGKSHLIFEDLTLSHADYYAVLGSTRVTEGTPATNIIFRNLVVDHSQAANVADTNGIYFLQASTTLPMHDIEIASSTFYGNSGTVNADLIKIRVQNTLGKNINIHDNTFYNASSEAIDLSGGDANRIERNTIINPGGICIKIFANDVPLRNAIIRNNVCINDAGDEGIALQDVDSGIVVNNTFDARGVAYAGAAFDVQQSGFGSFRNTRISNNIFVANYSAGVWRTYNHSSSTFNAAATTTNNILRQAGAHTTIVHHTNDVPSNITLSNFAQWVANGHPGNLTSDPVFSSSSPSLPEGLSLRHDSPAIDAGTTTALHTATSTDFFGNPIYGTPDIGAIEYQPSYVSGTHDVPTTGAIRLYADGKFRERIASTTAATSDLTVTPQGGWGSGDYREYMDIEIDTWTPTSMAWTATSSIATTTVFTMGGLTPNGWYNVQLDTATSSSIGGATCANSVCQANGSGVLAFTYAGSWSTHSFEVTPGSKPNSGGGVCRNCGSGSSKDAPSSTDSVRSTSPAEQTGTTTTQTGSAPSTGTPFRCTETSTPEGGLSPAGLVNLLVSLGIIPDAKAKPACDALSAKSAETPGTPSMIPFSTPLRLGARGAEVTRLQVFLNTRGFLVAESGDGSRGNETDFYGVLTERAVKRFQAASTAEILAPVGLTAPSGFWGPSSMRKANALLGL